MRIKQRATSVVFIALATIVSMLASPMISAHGAVEFPKARQYICYEQGGYNWPPDGSLIPNAACQAAYLQVKNNGGNGAYQFDQWHEVSANPANYNDQASVEQAVPDGLLCAGGDRKKAGLDVPSRFWKETPIHLQNGHFQLAYRAAVTHSPSFVKIYLSAPGYSPAERPLRWSDLQQPIFEGPAPLPQSVAGKNYYFYNVPIPAGRTGPAVLYVRWQREDTGNEGFYNCSDILLEGPGMEQPLYDKGPYVSPSIRPNPGEQVRFRVLGHTRSGAEVVDVKLPITAANQSTAIWAEQLAKIINNQHASRVVVGVRHGDESQVHYDATNFERNMVYVKNEGDSPAMSIIPGEVPGKPPVATISGATTVEAGKTLELSGASSTGSGLTYAWSAPNFTPSSSTESSVTLTAPGTAGSANISLTVTDSDQRTNTANQSVTVTTGGGGGTCTVPAWSASKTYATYAEQVSYAGKVYRQNFWSVNQAPDQNSAPWGQPWVYLHDCP